MISEINIDVGTGPFDPLPPPVSPLVGTPSAHVGAVARGDRSAREMVLDALERITERDAHLGVFITVMDQAALARADALDRAHAAGEPSGPLHGMTLAVKDCIDVAGVPTTCGTAGRGEVLAASTAPCVAAMEAAGAIVVGKTNMHEWAYGATSDNPHFGPVRHPHDPERIPGGSSGGSAVAVATGMAALALGTDTGGSVRIPAAYCGVSGLKVTPGRISTVGVEPLSWTLDGVGLMAADIGGISAAYRVLAATGRLAMSPANKRAGPRRIATIPDFFGDARRQDAAVHVAIDHVLDRMRGAGAEVVAHAMPELDWVADAFFPIVLSEGAAVHSGARRADRPTYGQDIQEALALGDLVSAVDYINALRARSVLASRFAAILHEVDVVVAPVSPTMPVLRGTTIVSWPDGGEEPFLDACARFCLPPSFAGLPALAVPVSSASGATVGIQIIGNAGAEEQVIEVGAWLAELTRSTPDM